MKKLKELKEYVRKIDKKDGLFTEQYSELWEYVQCTATHILEVVIES